MGYRSAVRLRRTAAFVLLAVALGGCRTTDNPTVEAGDTTAPTTGSTVPVTTPPSTAAPVTPPISVPALAERAYLTAVRVAATDSGGSRVVFEFDPVVPGYLVDYIVRPVTEDGSGEEVTVEGDALLQVRMENASGARIEGEKVIRTYTGPDRVPATGTGGVVTEAVDTGDFEGVVNWTVGLRKKAPAITVTTLSGPSRLVIDVPAPAT